MVEALSVRSWPTYLLRDIPEQTRAALEEDARFTGQSMIELIREILCSRYDLNCESVTHPFAKPPPPSKGTKTMLLRLQPEVFAKLKEEAGTSNTAYGSPRGAMDKIIHSALADHYNGGHPQ